MESVLNSLATAEMSAMAGLIALSRHLLPGHAFFVGDAFAISTGTAWPGNPPVDEATVEQYLEHADTVEEFSHQGRTILWGLTIPQSILPSSDSKFDKDPRTPHQVLTEACVRTFGAETAAAKVLSINGIVGGVTRDLQKGWHVEAIAAVVHDRIKGRPDLFSVLEDRDFVLYLHKRATAIVARRSGA
jgi:hypothetical protein